MSRTFKYGDTTKEIAIGRHAMTKADFQHREKTGKIYPCAKCNKPLTIFEHVKFLFMCKSCTDGGLTHYTQESNGKLVVTN